MATLGVFTRAKQDDPTSTAPMTRILQTLMRGNAVVQGQEQAKQVASAQMDANAKTVVTLKPNPAGGEPLVTLKDAPASLLNQTQEQEVQDAFDAPRLAVESKLAPTSATTDEDPLASLYDIADKHLGYHVPRPSDPDIAEKLKTPDGIRDLTREIGGTTAHAEQAISALRSGKLTVGEMRNKIAKVRAKKFEGIYASIQKPLDEAQDIATRATTVDKATSETARAKIDRLTGIVDKVDLSDYPQDQWASVVEERYGESLTDFQKSQLTKKGDRDQRTRAIADYKDFKTSIGNFDNAEDAKRAFGRFASLDDTQRARFVADWRVAATNRKTDEKKDALELKKLSQDTAPLPTSGSGGEAALASLPEGTRALVKKIANYEMDLKSVTSLRGGERERIASIVAQYDPTFDMTQYAARAAVRRDFTSGKAAGNIRSINTAVKHLDSLSKAAEGLDNRSITLWNALANKVISNVGDPRVVRFNSAANAVESEMASVFKGMGATDQEIKSWREQLNAAQSPQQLKTAIDTMIELMGGRLSAMETQWMTNMGKPVDFQILSKESEKILGELGADIHGSGASQKPTTVRYDAKGNRLP